MAEVSEVVLLEAKLADPAWWEFFNSWKLNMQPVQTPETMQAIHTQMMEDYDRRLASAKARLGL